MVLCEYLDAVFSLSNTHLTFYSYDLPPTTHALPLSVVKASITKTGALKHKAPYKNEVVDDTPRAFARLMAYQTTGRKPPCGLDDGPPPSKKRKRQNDSTVDPTNGETITPALPKIHPSEHLADFSARVNASLPVSGLITRSKAYGTQERKTKLERRMQRMQKEWRELEARRKERRDEERDEKAVDEDDEEIESRASKGKEKRKRRKQLTEDDGGDEGDPWAKIAASRQRNVNANSGLVGLHDVVQAPPKLPLKIKQKLEAPKSVTGGLRRQGELEEGRRSIVEGYRRMMNEKRKEAPHA